MSSYPGEDPQQPRAGGDEGEPTAPVTPSGPTFNPSSAETAGQTGSPPPPNEPPTTPYQQPYQQPGHPGYGQLPPPYLAFAPRPPMHPQSTLSMVLGIVGLVGALMLCGLPLVVSPFAWAIGRNALTEIAASEGRLGGENEARIGQITGIIGTVLLVVAVLAMVAFAAVMIAGISMSDELGSTY